MTAAGGDDRPMRYVEHAADGRPLKIVYRNSSLGGCERAFVACASGVPALPHPQWFQDVLDEGTGAEDQILAMWDEASGIPTVSQQQEMELHLMDVEVAWTGADSGVVEVPVVVRMHIDGAAAALSGQDAADGYPVVLREAKKFRDSTWPRFLRSGCEVNANYPWQVSGYMYAVREMDEAAGGGGRYPLVEMIGGHWSEMQEAETGHWMTGITEVSVRYIDNPPIPLRAIKKKIARIERLVAEGYGPTDPEVACREDSYPCGYWKLHPSELAGGKKHGAAGTAVVKIPAAKVSDEVQKLLIQDTALAGRLKGLADDEKKIKAAQKEVRDQLKAWVQEQGYVLEDVEVGAAEGREVAVEAGGYEVIWKRSPRKGYEVQPTVVETFTVKAAETAEVKVRTRTKKQTAADEQETA